MKYKIWGLWWRGLITQILIAIILFFFNMISAGIFLGGGTLIGGIEGLGIGAFVFLLVIIIFVPIIVSKIIVRVYNL